MSRVDDIRWGVKFGMGLALVCCVFVGLTVLVRGSIDDAHPGLSVWRVFAIYVVTGVAGGTLMGLVRRVARGKPSSVLVGMIVATFAYSAISLGLQGIARFSIWVTLFAGVTVGGVLGYVFAQDS